MVILLKIIKVIIVLSQILFLFFFLFLFQKVILSLLMLKYN